MNTAYDVLARRDGMMGSPGGPMVLESAQVQVLKEEVQVEEEVVEEEPKETGRIRSLFPETWLWDIVSVGWVG